MTENSTSPSDIGSIFEEAAPGFDRQRYDVALGALDITPAQRAELLSTLWAILQNLVHLNFSIADTDVYGVIFGEVESMTALNRDSAIDGQHQPLGGATHED